MSEQFSFSDLRDLFANANEEKSGDRLAGIAARELLQSAFSQPLHPLRYLLKLLFQALHRFPVDLQAGAFVRIIRIALLLPTSNVPPDARPCISQPLLGIDAIPRCASSRYPRVPGGPNRWRVPAPPPGRTNRSTPGHVADETRSSSNDLASHRPPNRCDVAQQVARLREEAERVSDADSTV